MNPATVDEKIHHTAKQFLCNVPIIDYNWNNIWPDLTYDYQEVLISETVNSKLVLKYPTQINNQKTFLKCIIDHLEKQNSEIHDEVYSAYGRLVALQGSSSDYFKHYLIERSGRVITLKENINLISDGTTGLRTWQASLALSEWALQNGEALKNTTILELGSGVGLLGLTIAMECSPTRIYFTDCHSSVLQSLCDNVKLNIDSISINTEVNEKAVSSDRLKILLNRCLLGTPGHSDIFVLNLSWEDVQEEECKKLGKINKVIAADVVYDETLFPPLIKAMQNLDNFCDVEEFIFSCTVRNLETLALFIDKITEASFTLTEMQVPTQKYFIWPTDTPVRMFSIRSLNC